MKVLVIGSGGREHCLAWKISKSSMVEKVFAAPGNAGMCDVARCVDIGSQDFPALTDFAESEDIGLTVVGPEAPLVGGIADYFNLKGLKVFGPGRDAARLEGSKVFTKRLSKKYGIPSAEGLEFSEKEYAEAKKYIDRLGKSDYPRVLKADGLAAGKGVIIANSREEALACLENFFVVKKFGDSAKRIIIEDFLEGYEVSLLCLYDGNSVLAMDLAQDYKRIYDKDMGPNTGGMGSYSPVPFVSEDLKQKILDDIIYPTCRGLKAEGIDYRGVLYAGLMVCGEKPYLLEYNCRFGDPETQAILPRLEDDLMPYLIDCTQQTLDGKSMSWEKSKGVCVITASRGYPQSSSKGDIIEGLQNFKTDDDILIFHAGTKKDQGRLVTDGGRVLGVVGKAESFKSAREKVYAAMDKINFSGMQYRKDIALRVEEDE
ncbi:MAG: phosphoribosylamine--glycine ligase [Actinomycetota bacterium]